MHDELMKLILFLILSPCLFAQSAVWVNYDQNSFDSDTCCWRMLSRQGRFEESAKLIVDFLHNGKVVNTQSLNWHAGQMFAFAGKNTQALRYFNKTYNVFQKWFGGEDGKAWFYFAKGSSAFIKRNKLGLEKIIRYWKAKLPMDNNYRELVRLLENWSLPYEKAIKSAASDKSFGAIGMKPLFP